MRLGDKELENLKTTLEVKKTYLKYYRESYENALSEIRSIEKTIAIIESGQKDFFDELE